MDFLWRKWSRLLGLWVILLLAASGVCGASAPDGSRRYAGTIDDNIAVHLALERKGTEISGWYYYDSQRIRLTLRGEASGNSFFLKEYDENGNSTGSFQGTFAADGAVEGYWRAPDGATRLPFRANALSVPGPGQVAKLDYSSLPAEFTVSFSPGRPYIVSVGARSKTSYGFELKVYQDEKLVLEKTLVGDGGEIGLARARGSGRLDLVAVLSGGNGGYLNDFCLIGETGDGIGLLAGKDLLGTAYTWPTVTAFTDKIGVEFNPPGAWPRYRVDVIWRPESESYVRANPVRITPRAEMPAADKTVFFSLRPDDKKVSYFAGNAVITEVHIKAGGRLLLRRDPAMDQELALSYWGSYDKAVIRPEFVEGSFLITANNPGTTKLAFFQPHNATTGQELTIIVDR